jgi:hypothetical protein
MNRTVLAVSVAAVLAVAPATAGVTSAGAVSGGPPDTYLTTMDSAGQQAFAASGLTPPDGHLIFGYVAIATYDAVMAVDEEYEPFAVDENAPGASAEAAAITAAYRVFAHYMPSQAGIVATAYGTALGSIAPSQAKTDGVAVGERVAAALIAQRADDGFRIAVPYTVPNPPTPGAWIPTPPAANPLQPPIGTYLAAMRPFALRSADQFRPNGPPGLDSKKWAREYNEVKDIGSASSTTRTPQQTLAARFWAEAPVQQARGSFRKFVLDHQLDIVQAARFLAMASVTYADAFIACGDAKYHYAFWRPITAIRAGDSDGNDATAGEPTWTPVLPATPNHPDYPSAHSCLTPSTGIVISRFLGTEDIDFTVPSLTGLGDRHFATAEDLRYEVSNARIWGGIHFRSAVEDGTDIAKRTANWVLAHNFQRIDD